MAEVTPRARAFTGSRYSRVIYGINKLANHAAKLGKVQFDADELRLLFVQDWQRSPLTIAYELTEGGTHSVQTLYAEITNPMPMLWKMPRMEFEMRWDTCKDGFLVPKSKGYTVEAPAKIQIGQTPLRSKFEQAVMHECRIAFEWGLVQWVFRQLCEPAYCSTPAQVRYLWPALLPILRAGGEDDLAEQLAEPSPRAGDSARCPSWVSSYIKPTYDIVAKGVLLREVPLVESNGGIPYKLHSPVFEMGNGLSYPGHVPT